MPSERTRVYLDDLDDRFEDRDQFYKNLNEKIKKEKQKKIKQKNTKDNWMLYIAIALTAYVTLVVIGSIYVEHKYFNKDK